VSAILGRVAQKPKRKNKNFAQNLKKISEITDHTDVTSAALITNAVNNSGLTIKEYATRHGYPYHTVRNLVYGKTCGKFGLPAKIVASVMCKDTPLANGVSLHSKHKKLNVQLALKGYHSLTDWANKHGFNHDTVRSAIRRYCGAHGRSPRYNSQTPKILAALSKTLGQSCMGLQVTNELAHAQPWLRQQAYWRQNVIC
jgi:lambda repressor-like predicted transcriptional regulator